MIRSSKHSLKFANTGKQAAVAAFMLLYRQAVQFSIDFIWSHQLQYKESVFNIQTDQLNLPLFLDYKLLDYQGSLSARAFCSALEQARGMVSAATQKRNQVLFIRDQKIAEGKAFGKLQALLDGKYQLKKPSAAKVRAELSNKCIDFEFADREQDAGKLRHFDLFIRIKSTGMEHIRLPLKLTKPFIKRKDWAICAGVSIAENGVILRQEKETPTLRMEGEVLGADKGMLTVLSLSDKQQTQPDKHGHTFASIAHKLERKKKGSKAFRRAQEHRLNYINFSLKQLNFDGVRKLNLEINNFSGSKMSRFLSHNAHAAIDNKLLNLLEELGVQVAGKSSAFKSQRCYGCGWVQKKNRKGKEFCCCQCGYCCDSDTNSALNNSLDELPEIPYWAVSCKLNRKGFFWKEGEPLRDLQGQEIRVPAPVEG